MATYFIPHIATPATQEVIEEMGFMEVEIMWKFYLLKSHPFATHITSAVCIKYEQFIAAVCGNDR